MTHPLEAENRRLREALDETRRRAMTLGYTGLAHFIGVTMMDLDAALRYAAPPASGEETVFSISQLEELRERLSEFGSNGLDASTCLGLLEAIAALRQRADEATRAENEACAELAERNPFAQALDIAFAIRARIAPRG